MGSEPKKSPKKKTKYDAFDIIGKIKETKESQIREKPTRGSSLNMMDPKLTTQ